MSIEFKLPELGEGIDGGDLTDVYVKEGDTIAEGQDVLEIETGKAVLPVPCPHAGRIGKLHVKAGDHVDVGAVLMTIESAGQPQKPAEAASAAPAEEASRESEAAAPRPQNGSSTEHAATTKSGDGLLPAGPATRRIARELGVDLHAVAGSGPRGRITPEDVREAAQGAPAPAQVRPTAAPSAPAARPAPAPVERPGVAAADKFGPVRREKLSQIRKTIARQMSYSASTIPHVTNFDEVDITELEQIRKGVPAGQFGAGVKLTLLPFVMKSVALALREHPLLNSSLAEETDEIVYKDYVHLGVAVDTPRGLIVPVIKNVDRMSIPEIARSMSTLIERTRNSQFSLEDLKGGTFTISNLGAVGGRFSTPIINHPEVAILLLGRGGWRPMLHEGEIEPRLLLPLSLSYDHRLVDGAEAARFLNKVMERLLSPGQLLLAE